MMEKNRLKLIVVMCVLVFLPAGLILMVKLEGEKPSVVLNSPLSGIGISQNISVSVFDAKSGMRRVRVGLLKDNKEFILFKKEFPSGGLFWNGRIKEDAFNVPIQPKAMGITQGKAILQILARDLSWRGWWNGNKTFIQKEVMVDTRAPEIKVLTKNHNISQGGANLVIYRLSEPCAETGVYVGENFFPGYSCQNIIANAQASPIFMAFIALNYDQARDTDIFVHAADFSGNSTRKDIPYYIGKRSFKKDIINISDKFLGWKVSEFPLSASDQEEETTQKNPSTSLMEKFLAINRDLRESNFMEFVEIAKNTDKNTYWAGRFKALPKSARMAGFGDRREYRYRDRAIDHQIHKGVDMASVAHAPIPAANSGKIAYVGDIGIYGKTVVIDHGFGLFSTYSHLSSIHVKKGQMVKKGKTIGRTGKTGLAGGDHLHFGILIHNTFVNPVEWLDGAWVRNHISKKIKALKSRFDF